MKSREGDFLETAAGLIFDVKGLVHPPNRIVAFIRYFRDEKGGRERDGTTYRKVYSLSKRYAVLRESFPQYLVFDPVFGEKLCEVPRGDVKWHHRPAEKLQEMRSSENLDLLESKALRLVDVLRQKASISWNAIGISGSILVGLHRPHSDIDPIVYGSESCWKVYSALQDFLSTPEGFKLYDHADLESLFDFRSKDTSADFESFVRTESRKVMQGRFEGTDYFLRFVKDWAEVSEVYGDVRYRNAGVAEIKAKIADDSESIFTPCVYKIKDAQILSGSQVGVIEEIASFRGRFCEQARMGELVVARGKVERVMDRRHGREYFRLLLGNHPSDFMILA
jgi:predicted nucleotidyltransferase